MKTSPVSLFDLARNACAILIVAYAAGSVASNTPIITTSPTSYFDSAGYGTGAGTGVSTGTFPAPTDNYGPSVYSPHTTGSDRLGVQSGTTYAMPQYSTPEIPNYTAAPGSTPFEAGDTNAMPKRTMPDSGNGIHSSPSGLNY